jgi:hypothetical protein
MGYYPTVDSIAITRLGVDSFGHLLVFAACHWLHSVAAAAGCRAAARERQDNHKSRTEDDFTEDAVFVSLLKDGLEGAVPFAPQPP